MNDLKILTIIPARSESKGIPHKNIKLFNGDPLLACSIKQAKDSKYFVNMKIFVSTDSERYAGIAKKYGAEVPILRPKSISQDHSSDYEFMLHALNYYNDQGYQPDLILQLRPTQPCRKVEDIDKCIELFIDNIAHGFTSLRTVIKQDKTPYKMYHIKGTVLKPLFKEVNGLVEPYNQGRQLLPQTYLHNGYIDIVLPNIIKEGSLSGDRILPYIMKPSDTIDIDTIDDWIKAEKN